MNVCAKLFLSITITILTVLIVDVLTLTDQLLVVYGPDWVMNQAHLAQGERVLALSVNFVTGFTSTATILIGIIAIYFVLSRD